mgnify:CR=1 FL=1
MKFRKTAKKQIAYFYSFQHWFIEIWKSWEAEEHAVDELSQLLQGAGGRVGVLLLQRCHQPGDVREQLEKESSLPQKWLQVIHKALTEGHSTEVDFSSVLDFIIHPMNSTANLPSNLTVQIQGYQSWGISYCTAPASLCCHCHSLWRSILAKTCTGKDCYMLNTEFRDSDLQNRWTNVQKVLSGMLYFIPCCIK